MQLQARANPADSLRPDSETHVALFVDLDGTLVKTDLLLESFFSRVREDPLVVMKSLWWLLHGRARLKAELARAHAVDVRTLPFNEPFLNYLRAEAARGRRLILATAAHRSLAEAVASHVGIFSGVIATEGSDNLKGAGKLAAIRAEAGERGFDYAGNGAEDLPIWAQARRAIPVDCSAAVKRQLDLENKVEASFLRENSLRSLWLALRPHQWLKNALIFVPLLTSVSFLAVTPWLQAITGFIAFCALASSTYILNDLLDLQADRAHPRKWVRPLASGAVPLSTGLLTSGGLLIVGLAISLLLPWQFAIFALIYVAVTVSYSVWLKGYVLADVLTLALLYTLRIIAGIAAIEVPSSFWLLSFSMFLFFSLALVKRCAELAAQEERGKTTSAGRGYQVRDLAVLQPLGVASACVAVLVLALYIDSSQVTERLTSPQVLWPICPAMLYWLARLWIKTLRGEMHDDPLIFAVKDPVSLFIGLTVLASFIAAALTNVPRII